MYSTHYLSHNATHCSARIERSSTFAEQCIVFALSWFNTTQALVSRCEPILKEWLVYRVTLRRGSTVDDCVREWFICLFVIFWCPFVQPLIICVSNSSFIFFLLSLQLFNLHRTNLLWAVSPAVCSPPVKLCVWAWRTCYPLGPQHEPYHSYALLKGHSSWSSLWRELSLSELIWNFCTWHNQTLNIIVTMMRSW